MNTENAKTNVIEIDLVSLLKRFLVQWRAIFLCAIIFGCLVGGAKYVKDRSAYQSAVADLNTSANQKIKETGLTEEETDAVQTAVALKKKIGDLNEYNANSIYMSLDAMNTKRMSLLYYIKADAGSDAADLMTVYSEMLRSDDSIKKIREAAEIKAPVKYVRELVVISDAKSSDRGGMTQDSSTDIMKVDFLLSEKMDVSAVEDTIDDLVTSYDVSSLGIASGTIRKISSEINVVMDSDIQDWQDKNNNNLSSYENQYTNAVNAFSDDQKNLLKTLLKKNKIEDEDSKTSTKKSENDADSTASSSKENVAAKDADAETLPAQPSFSIKYFAIGFILGILIYMFLELIYEILGSKWSSVAGYGTNRLGKLYDPEHQKTNFLLFDKLVFRWLYKKEIDTDNSIERILVRAQMNSMEDKLQAFELWLTGFEEDGIVEAIAKAAAAKGISMTVRTSADGKPDEMIGKTAEGKSVAVAVRSGVSRKKDASFLTEMLCKQKTDYLGLIELI